MILIYIPLNTNNTSNYNFVSSFLALSTSILLLTIGLLCNTPISPSNFFAHFLYPHPTTKPPLPPLAFLLLPFHPLLPLLSLLFLLFCSFYSSLYFLYLLHFSFHIDHLAAFSAQSIDSVTSTATALLKTNRNLLISNDQQHL
jgi:hypothetical protein